MRRALRGDLVAADLHIPISWPATTDLDVVVDDGNNPPLELHGVSAELAPLPSIYFESPAGEPLTARFGAPKLAAPTYDLEAMRETFTELRFVDAQWGPVHDFGPVPTPLPPMESSLPATGAPIDVSSFAYARKILPGPPGLAALPLDVAVLAHSARFNDLRIVDVEGNQVPYLLERLDEPLAVDLPELQPLPPRSGSATGRESRYRLTLPYATLPPARLVLSTTSRVFTRPVALRVERPPLDGRATARTEQIIARTWAHTLPETAAPDLVLDLPALGVDTAELVINEGDNTALPLAPPRLLLPGYRLRFFRSAGGELTLVYGRTDLKVPHYDIALVAARLASETAHDIEMAPEVPATTLPVRHGTGSQTKLFWGALVAAVIVLIALIIRLLGNEEDPASLRQPPASP